VDLSTITGFWSTIHNKDQFLLNYLVPDPKLLGSGPQELLGSGPQDWFLIIDSSYFTTTQSGPIDGS
jgi:hypothetical protein